MVKPGYKQTEIGVLPEEWEVTPAQELMKIETGGKNTENKTDSGDYPFFVRSSKIEKIDTFHYDCEAVLTAGDGVGTGKVFHYYIGKFDAHQRVYIMSNFNSIFGKYFYYYFSENFGEEVAKYTAKSSVDSVRRDMIANMSLPIPPIFEQEAIATALSDMDALIDNLEKLIAKKKAIKQGAMQELLTGKRRLPGVSGEWKEQKLKELCDIEMGQSPDSRFYSSSEGIPLVQGNADIEDRKTIIRNYTKNITKCASKGDVIFTVRAPVGNVAYAVFDCCIGRGVCALKGGSEFIYHLLVFKQDMWSTVSTGSTFDSINSDTLNNTPFWVPVDNKEQTAIATILSDMDNELEQLKKNLAKYKKIKSGMMSELLTGRIRLV